MNAPGALICRAASVRAVELTRVLPLRREVLRWPDDAFDGDLVAKTRHLAVVHDCAIIAAVSYMPSPCPERRYEGGCYFWAMAVAPEHQRHGHGRALIGELRARAGTFDANVLWADARETALPFYKSCGAVTVGEPYTDDVTGLTDFRVILLSNG
jgi:GNAT superfamily N-acetyltransferase